VAWLVQNVSESSSTDQACRFYYHFDDALNGKQDQQYVSPKLGVGLPRSSYTKSSAGLPEFAGQLSRSTPEEPKSSALHSMDAKRAQLLQLHAAEDGSTTSNASPGPAQLTTFPSKGSRRKSFIGELHK
jgi:hypothetical protein